MHIAQPGHEIGQLIQKVDPWSNSRITFSEAVTGLAAELLNLASQEKQQQHHQQQPPPQQSQLQPPSNAGLPPPPPPPHM